ncbi:MAG: hypothetical protein GEU90_11180 [Gemmatimonas sp.]|nr:hypothetical protein [Gemmatimonas sp.]
MKPWYAVVVAPNEPDGGAMVSRIPSFLHPVAGRPLIWHSVNSILGQERPPEEVLVVTPPEFGGDHFQDLSVRVRTLDLDSVRGEDPSGLGLPETRIVVTHASAGIEGEPLERLLGSEEGAWLGGREGEVVATLTDWSGFSALLDADQPFATAADRVEPSARLHETPGVFQVHTRADLAVAHRRIRDGLVRSLMTAGVTFLLPETVMVDVDVRIGRDTMIYPGVAIEGQSTVGEETVVGPGCRIIDSWIGSGVELKGWNYIANTSVRNRAILEPYVRRGFD